MKELLRILTDFVAISGEEEMFLKTIKNIFKNDEVSVEADKMNNIIVYKKGEKKGKVWMSAHLDEIGLIVTKVEKAYIKFSQVGGYDEKVLLGQQVIVFGDKKYKGIIGAKPPHLMDSDEYGKMLTFRDLFIDIGKSADFVKKHIKVGDRIVIKHGFQELKNNLIATKALDNRACAAIIITALKHLLKTKNLPDIYVVLNAQEETTFLGAKVASYKVFPDIAFVTDVTFAKQPGVPNGHTITDVIIGKGSHIAPALFEHIKNVAEEEEINYSIEALPSGSGTDTGVVQMAKSGVTTVLVSLPVKNMHSPVEIGNIKTMEKMAKLLAKSIETLKIKDFDIKTIK